MKLVWESEFLTVSYSFEVASNYLAVNTYGFSKVFPPKEYSSLIYSKLCFFSKILYSKSSFSISLVTSLGNKLLVSFENSWISSFNASSLNYNNKTLQNISYFKILFLKFLFFLPQHLNKLLKHPVFSSS